MYIEPQTNIRILKNVPLDNTYEHTIWFEGNTEQSTYFQSLQKYNLTNYTYQRVQRGVARVGIVADNLYDCNYMMFQNTAYGNKWFYAFITSVEYVNNEMSTIAFEIDVMQTWHFDYQPDYCFVEREHSVNDYLFENLVPEELATGNYIVRKLTEDYYTDFNVDILFQEDSAGDKAPVDTYENVVTPLWRMGFAIPDAIPELEETINTLLDKGDNNIVQIIQFPSYLNRSTFPVQSFGMNTSTIDGHTVRNKKLFNFPFTFMEVNNGAGEAKVFKWELSDSRNNSECALNFAVVGSKTNVPTMMCIPYNYAGVNRNINEGVVLSVGIEVPWLGDVYRTWLASNQTQVNTSLVASAVGMLVNIGTTVAGANAALSVPAAPRSSQAVHAARGAQTAVNAATNLIESSVSSLAGIAGVLAKETDLKNTVSNVYGQSTSSTLRTKLDCLGYTFAEKTITKEMAEIIDGYFDRFGYATHLNKIPNRNSRPHWNYVKTMGATLTGSVPTDDMRRICSIYDNGITFWKNGSEVGNYSLDNTV